MAEDGGRRRTGRPTFGRRDSIKRRFRKCRCEEERMRGNGVRSRDMETSRLEGGQKSALRERRIHAFLWDDKSYSCSVMII